MSKSIFLRSMLKIWDACFIWVRGEHFASRLLHIAVSLAKPGPFSKSLPISPYHLWSESVVLCFNLSMYPGWGHLPALWLFLFTPMSSDYSYLQTLCITDSFCSVSITFCVLTLKETYSNQVSGINDIKACHLNISCLCVFHASTMADSWRYCSYWVNRLSTFRGHLVYQVSCRDV